MGDLASDFGDTSLAVFHYSQYVNPNKTDPKLTAIKFTQNFQKKVKALLKLVKCAFRLRLYQEAVLILRKALQYAWKAKDRKLELKIYEDMGLAYFYLGDIAKSEYYHHW